MKFPLGPLTLTLSPILTVAEEKQRVNEGKKREDDASVSFRVPPKWTLLTLPQTGDRSERKQLTSLQVLGDVSLLVRLDDEIEVSTVVVSGGGSVGSSDDLLSDGSLDLDVLSNGESEDGSRRVERESVAVVSMQRKGKVE